MAAPKYMTQAKGVYIFLSDGSRCVLSPDEATRLTQLLDGRLLTSGTRITPEQMQAKPPVLAVAYPYGTGETHIHVYADGTAGHLRTLRSYEVYPMERYCTEAIRLADKHGVLESRTNDASQASEAIGAGTAPQPQR